MNLEDPIQHPIGSSSFIDDGLPMGGWICTRKAWDEAGGYMEPWRIGYDNELEIRMRKAGRPHRVVNLPPGSYYDVFTDIDGGIQEDDQTRYRSYDCILRWCQMILLHDEYIPYDKWEWLRIQKEHYLRGCPVIDSVELSKKIYTDTEDLLYNSAHWIEKIVKNSCEEMKDHLIVMFGL